MSWVVGWSCGVGTGSTWPGGSRSWAGWPARSATTSGCSTARSWPSTPAGGPTSRPLSSGWPAGSGGGGAPPSPTSCSTCCGWTAGCSPACPCRAAAAAGGPGGGRPGLADGGVVPRHRHRPAGRDPRSGPGGGGGQAAPEHLPAGPADQELAQDQALPARDVPDRRVRAQPRPGPVAAGRPARPGAAGRLRFAGRVDHGLVPAARRRLGELLGPLVVDQSPFAEPPAALLGGRWARPGPDDPPRCSSGPRWPSRSPSSAGSRAACATLPTAA
jgi:hypothetical protein